MHGSKCPTRIPWRRSIVSIEWDELRVILRGWRGSLQVCTFDKSFDSWLIILILLHCQWHFRRRQTILIRFTSSPVSRSLVRITHELSSNACSLSFSLLGSTTLQTTDTTSMGITSQITTQSTSSPCRSFLDIFSSNDSSLFSSYDHFPVNYSYLDD